MPPPEVQVGRAEDDERYLASDQLGWFDEVTDQPTADQLLGVPPDQRFAADIAGADRGTYPGIYGVRPLQLAVPVGDAARLVPCAGLTWVAVHPDHRRRGVLSAMIRHHVEQTHREGCALSALHASEPAIYGRQGYGVATSGISVTLARGTAFTAPALEGAADDVITSLATQTGDDLAIRVRDCELRLAATTPGMVGLELDVYRRIVHETAEDLRGKEPRRYLFAERDGVDVGFAVFRRTHKWERNRPQGTLEVPALFGDAAARLALLRRLVDVDLMATVRLPEVGVDDELWHWIGPRADAEAVPVDNLWVRVIDLAAALPLRSYDAECDVVVEVADPYAPWQAGRWRITVRGGEGRAERTEVEPDVELPVAALGAAYLGGSNLVAMHRAGVLAERRRGAIRELWHAFRTDLAPAAAAGF